MIFFFHRKWAATVFWALQLFLMLVGFVKVTTLPARSTKDSTPNSIILTVSQGSYLLFSFPVFYYFMAYAQRETLTLVLLMIVFVFSAFCA